MRIGVEPDKYVDHPARNILLKGLENQQELESRIKTAITDTTAEKINEQASLKEGSPVGIDSNGKLRKVFPTAKASMLLPGVDWSLPSVATGRAVAINNAIAGAFANGGGKVILPPETIVMDDTIDNKYPRVMVEVLEGNNMMYSVTKSHGCTIVPAFAGTVLKHRTPYAVETGGIPGPRNDGGGFKNMRVIGNGQATRLLEVDSIANGAYHMTLDGCVGGEAALFKCGVTGTDLSEATNIQHASVRLAIRQIDAGLPRECDGVRFQGSINSNFCFNEDVDLDIQHYNGDAIVGESADNNLITFRGRRVGGTGLPIRAKAATALIPVGFDTNTFLRYSCNVAGYAEGTGDPGAISAITNLILGLDNANGTPVPTAGTGSVWVSLTLNGLLRAFAATGFVIADNANTALAERTALGTKGLVISNGNEGHLTLQNNASAAKWLVRIITASGNLQFLRQAGTGTIDLGTALRILGGDVSVGANDSAGAGFRTLRIPNA